MTESFLCLLSWYLTGIFLFFWNKNKYCGAILMKASLVAHMVKNLPAVQETWIWSLGLGDPLEKGAATHSSIPWTEEPGELQSMGLQRVGHNWVSNTQGQKNQMRKKGLEMQEQKKNRPFSPFPPCCNHCRIFESSWVVWPVPAPTPIWGKCICLTLLPSGVGNVYTSSNQEMTCKTSILLLVPWL